MTEKIFSKPERKAIFELFLTKTKLKFTDIQKQINIRSNHLAYHIKIMQQANIIEKINEHYQITSDAQKYIPLFSNLTGEKISPLPVALIALQNQNQILMIKRENRPYQNYYGLIGGRILHDETYKEASIRLIQKKSGITDIEFIKLCEIVSEQVKENNQTQHSFILFFTQLKTEDKQFHETKYGKLKWIDLNELEKHKIIPSDLWLLQNSLGKETKIKHVTMQTKNNILTHFNIY